MAQKKHREEKRSSGKTRKKKAARNTRVTATAKRTTAPKATGRKVRSAAKKKRPASPGAEISSPVASTLRGSTFSTGETQSRIGTASRAAGQSGDLQGIARKPVADSESVEELVEEGQAREAAAISGVEDALDHGEAEVHTHEVPEDDVPEEYRDED
jgi:hypothetical protein